MKCNEVKGWRKWLGLHDGHCAHDFDKEVSRFYCSVEEKEKVWTDEWTKCCLCGKEWKVEFYY